MADIDEESKSVAEAVSETDEMNIDTAPSIADIVEISKPSVSLDMVPQETSLLPQKANSQISEIIPDSPTTLEATEVENQPDNVDSTSNDLEQNLMNSADSDNSDPKKCEPQNSGDNEEFDLFKELESYKNKVQEDFPAESSESKMDEANVDWSSKADELLKQLPSENQNPVDDLPIESENQSDTNNMEHSKCESTLNNTECISKETAVPQQEVDEFQEPPENEDESGDCFQSLDTGEVSGTSDGQYDLQTTNVPTDACDQEEPNNEEGLIENSDAASEAAAPGQDSGLIFNENMTEEQAASPGPGHDSSKVESSTENSEDGCGMSGTETSTNQEATCVSADGQLCSTQPEECKLDEEEAMEISEKQPEPITESGENNTTATVEAAETVIVDQSELAVASGKERKEADKTNADETAMKIDDDNQSNENVSQDHDMASAADKEDQTGTSDIRKLVGDGDESIKDETRSADLESVNMDEDVQTEKTPEADVVCGVEDKNIVDEKSANENETLVNAGEQVTADKTSNVEIVVNRDEEDKAVNSAEDPIVLNVDEEKKDPPEHMVVNLDDDQDSNDKTTSSQVVVNLDEEDDKTENVSADPAESKGGKVTTNQSKSESSKESKSKSQKCIVCQKVGKCKYNIVRNGDIKHLCDDKCFKVFRSNPTTYLKGKNDKTSNGEKTPDTTSVCTFCKSAGVPALQQGTFPLKIHKVTKYFCQEVCRSSYKEKNGTCGYCFCDLTNVKGVAQAVGKDGVVQIVCSKECLAKYETDAKKVTKSKKPEDDVEIVGTSKLPSTTGAKTRRQSAVSCAVCGSLASVKHEIEFNKTVNKLCSDSCFSAFRYANKLPVLTCDNCKKPCGDPNCGTVQFMGNLKRFCTTVCLNSFKTKHQKVIPCAWCHAKKSNFDMVERVDTNNKTQLFCSLNCLSLYRVNLQATSNQSVTCDHCKKFAPAQYHLTMSDASVRNFCAYSCVMAFQAQFQQPQTASGRSQTAQPTQNKRGRSTRQSRGKLFQFL